jgi:hypothetical protein
MLNTTRELDNLKIVLLMIKENGEINSDLIFQFFENWKWIDLNE